MCVTTLLPCEMSSVLKAIILYALSSSDINRFSKCYLLILLPVSSHRGRHSDCDPNLRYIENILLPTESNPTVKLN